MIPFLAYRILPTQTIVRNNLHVGHVKEDIEALLLTLSPILYIFHRDIPKPHMLHSNVIQNLSIKTGTLSLLPLLGWELNDKGEYCFVDTSDPKDLTRREEAAREFRKFYNELASGKDRNVSTIEKFLQIRIPVPFASHSILPAQQLIKANIRLGHVKEDIESFLRPLVLLLHISKPDAPKPAVLDSFIIHKLSAKVGIFDVLQLFGYVPNGPQTYVWFETKCSEEISRRASVAEEFRRFYDELKKRKDEPAGILEYFISHLDGEFTPSSLYF